MEIFKNKSENVRVVILEKINNKYLYKKTEAAKNTWRDGLHPECCIGACELKDGIFSEQCTSCGYDTY